MDHWKRGAKVFIGPEMNCRTEATMAASQNLPIISYKCKDQTVSDKKKYASTNIFSVYLQSFTYSLPFSDTQLSPERSPLKPKLPKL